MEEPCLTPGRVPPARAVARATRTVDSCLTPECPFRSVARPVRDMHLAAEQLEGVGQDGTEDVVAVAATAGRAREVDDQRRAEQAGDTAGKQRVRRLVQALDADRLCDAGRLPLDDVE